LQKIATAPILPQHFGSRILRRKVARDDATGIWGITVRYSNRWHAYRVGNRLEAEWEHARIKRAKDTWRFTRRRMQVS
jgi:hypothetical protein